MNIQRIIALTQILLASLVSSVLGWDDGGHMLAARIAYDSLDGAVRARAGAAAAKLYRNGTNYSFVTLACWMDDIKERTSTSPYKGKFRTWHYINIGCSPHDPDAFTDTALTTTNGTIVSALSHAVSVIKTGAYDDIIPNDAVALAVIIHLVGDIHQPMHTASRYDPDTAKSERPNDAGGNALSIANLADTPWKKNLHTFWDEAYRRYYEDGKARAYPEPSDDAGLSEWIKRLSPLSLSVDGSFDPKRWARETQSLGCSFAYGTLGEPYGAKNIELKGPYVTEAASAAQRQIVLAGWRLAALLQNIYRK